MSEQEAAPQKPLSIYDLLPFMVDQTAAIAWQKLGLQHDPVTGQLDQDLLEARTAIDIVAFLVQQMESKLDEGDRRRVQTLVRDLRINFVQKSS